MNSSIQDSVKEKYKMEFYISWIKSNIHYASVGSFVLGFLVDSLTLNQIDDKWLIFQQLVFLLVSGFILTTEQLHFNVNFEKILVLQKIINYKNQILHFCLGSLLSAFTIFFFKSSSLATSFFTLILLSSLLLINELPQFQNSSSRLKWILFHIILISFLILFTPLVIGKVNLLSVIIGCIFYLMISIGLYYLIYKFNSDNSLAKNNILIPSSSVLMSFVICYTLQWIPPVPLTLEYIGIFHNIEKSNNIYKLTHFNSPWKFWNHGDQNFYFEESEKIYAFFRLKSPASISDKIQLHWFKNDSTFGWQSQDTIPISIQGGREEGYRGFGIKANYSEGQWKLQVETSDGREIGRIYFEVIKETNRNDRNTYIDYQ